CRQGGFPAQRALPDTDRGPRCRNVNGLVVFYADTITDSMRRTIEETERRRAKQMAYNEAHGITPTQVRRDRDEVMRQTAVIDIHDDGGRRNYYVEPETPSMAADPVVRYMSTADLEKNATQL